MPLLGPIRDPSQSSNSSLFRHTLAAGLSVDSSQESSKQSSSSITPVRSRSAYYHPHWSAWQDAYDLESMLSCSQLPSEDECVNFLNCFPQGLFGSEAERMAFNPEVRHQSDFAVCAKGQIIRYLWHFAIFLAYTFLLYIGYFRVREAFAIFDEELHSPPQDSTRSQTSTQSSQNSTQFPKDSSQDKPLDWLQVSWAESLIGAGITFLLAQAFFGYVLSVVSCPWPQPAADGEILRSAREHMERINGHTFSLAYSFLKSCGGGTQPIVFECLALLAAYPVVLLQELQQNTCEPNVTGYCREVGKRLCLLRHGCHIGSSGGPTIVNGRANNSSETTTTRHTYTTEKEAAASCRKPRPEFEQVDYFFEIFVLQLHMDYDTHDMRANRPSSMSNHIICNLNSHIDMFAEHGGICTRIPIMRELVDHLCQLGYTSRSFARGDACPVTYHWGVMVVGIIVAVNNPYKRAEWFVGSESTGPPGMFCSLFRMAYLSAVSALLTSVLKELHDMWDPYGKAINQHAYTMRNAMAIDHLVHDYYDDADSVVHPHDFW
ncbi:hypothetical protein L249_1841 [Ophiocordyceps polyrhachis-furcata BCC 54312]|uniref:Uncharacterized protein n=1 Tax=Ophiocordyceps polyrhachis-furcata BCC 54312 TaxID=1330021 RepID=A0A367LRW5_9HYPO|nr:hypothetical protein L249_1841 [Ophiocordyceps polyrhachis-furcata BCC 54312]